MPSRYRPCRHDGRWLAMLGLLLLAGQAACDPTMMNGNDNGNNNNTSDDENYRFVFESFTGVDGETHTREDGAAPSDSPLRISGSFPDFQIVWTDELRIQFLTVFAWGEQIYHVAIPGFDCSDDFASPVTYGAMSVTGANTTGWQGGPAPAIGVGESLPVSQFGNPPVVIWLAGDSTQIDYTELRIRVAGYLSADDCGDFPVPIEVTLRYRASVLTDEALADVCNGAGLCFEAEPE